ncbi:MAG: sigma-70 family RNA polymerase sigma factor [Myxococcales bacterium]
MGLFRHSRDPLRDEFEAEALPHLDSLYGNALRLTRSRVEAEDLVQETLLRAYRFYDRFERGTNVKAWLLRIQYNTFVNRYRRRTKERDITESMTREPTGEDVMSRQSLKALTDPVGTALRPMVVAEIEAALDELPEEHRTVIVLADVEELSYKEIAEVIGCPIGTVMSRLHRARRALRKRLVDLAEQQGVTGTAAAEPPAGEGNPDHESRGVAEPVSLERYRDGKRGRGSAR